MEYEIISGILSGSMVFIASMVMYLYKKQQNKIEKIDDELIKTRIHLSKKLDRSEVKEVIHDKLSAIQYLIVEIQKDINEIKDKYDG